MSNKTNFTLLWGKILDSSVWEYPTATRVVWIALLAEKDKDGYVLTSEGSLARRANVTPDECAAALRAFLAPDARSASEEDKDDGTRLEKVKGGWRIINHDKYKFSGADKRPVWREAQARRRLKLKAQAIPESSLPADASAALRMESPQEWKVRYEAPSLAEKYDPPVLPRPASLMTPIPEPASSESGIFRTPPDDPDNGERFAARQALRGANARFHDQQRAKSGLPPIDTSEILIDDSEAARAAQADHEAGLMEDDSVRDLSEPPQIQAAQPPLSPERQKLKAQREAALQRHKRNPSDHSHLDYQDHGDNSPKF